MTWYEIRLTDLCGNLGQINIDRNITNQEVEESEKTGWKDYVYGILFHSGVEKSYIASSTKQKEVGSVVLPTDDWTCFTAVSLICDLGRVSEWNWDWREWGRDWSNRILFTAIGETDDSFKKKKKKLDRDIQPCSDYGCPSPVLRVFLLDSKRVLSLGKQFEY